MATVHSIKFYRSRREWEKFLDYAGEKNLFINPLWIEAVEKTDAGAGLVYKYINDLCKAYKNKIGAYRTSQEVYNA